MNLKDIIKENYVEFDYYCLGDLNYRINYNNKVYMFSVPISDTGNGIFKERDKAIYFMRYIRKAIDNGTFIEKGNQ